MKGRANYLCLHRLDQLTDVASRPSGHQVFLPTIRQWSERTETGDRAEIEDLPEDLPLWSDISATAETCLGTDCPRHEDCFVTRMRQRAAESDIVIVNHHLLCADASVRQSAYGEVIPACHHAIIDEAHQLEDVATQYFGFSVSTYRIEDLARDLERLVAAGGIDHRKPEMRSAEPFNACGTARAISWELSLAPHRRTRAHEGVRRPTRRWRTRCRGAADRRARSGRIAAGAAQDAAPDAGPDSASRDRRDRVPGATGRRAGDELRFLLRAGDPTTSLRRARGRGVLLRAAPIDVSRLSANCCWTACARRC